MTNATPTTGDRVRGALATAGLRQRDVAARVGISQSQLSRRIAGKIPFSREEIATIADLCRVSARSLTSPRRRPTREAAA